MRVLLFVFFCLCSLSVFAQNAKIDSLKKVIETTKVDTVKARSLCRLCKVSASIGKVKEGLESGKIGLILAERSKDKKTEIFCIEEVNRALMATGELLQAVKNYQKSLELAESLDEPALLGRILTSLGTVKHMMGELPQAIDYQKRAIQILETYQDSVSLGKAYGALGIAYSEIGNSPLALDNLLKSLRIREKFADKNAMAATLSNIGIVYREIKDFNKALDYYHRSLKMRETIGDLKGIGNSYGNLGTVYLFKHDYAQALNYYQRALAISKKINNKYETIGHMCNIGSVYCIIEDYPKALEYYQQALQLSEEIGHKKHIAEVHHNMGHLYNLMKDPKKGKEFQLKALEFYLPTRNLEEIKSCYQYLAQSDSALGNYKSAYNYYGLYKLYDDSLTNVAKAKEFGRLESQFELEKQEKAIELLLKDKQIKSSQLDLLTKDKRLQQAIIRVLEGDKALQISEAEKKKKIIEILKIENVLKEEESKRNQKELDIAAQKEKLKESELKQQRIVTLSFVGGFLSILAVAFLLYRRNRNKTKTNLMLREKNKAIEQKNEEILTQNEEIQQQRDEIMTQSEHISKQNIELTRAFTQLKALDEFKEAMSNMIVHDLKNPLNTIIGLSGRNNLGEHDQLLIHQAGKQMLNLTLNILDVQKFEQTDVPLNLKDYPLADIASDAVRQINLLASNKNLKLIVEINVKTGVHADFELISRVFMNLLTNAIKFTPNNGKITISAEQTDHQITVAVSDTGQGIPADKLHTVFDKFSQVEAKKSGIVHSTGLGLTFCKMVVEAHGGRIWVTSKVNVGTTFYFNLPEAHTEVTATEQPIGMILEIPVLNDADKNALAEYLPTLQALDVYEGSEVLQILASITGSPAVHNWKNEIENAIFSSNQERYEELVKSGAV